MPGVEYIAQKFDINSSCLEMKWSDREFVGAKTGHELVGEIDTCSLVASIRNV